jgi:hypothetical protein
MSQPRSDFSLSSSLTALLLILGGACAVADPNKPFWIKADGNELGLIVGPQTMVGTSPANWVKVTRVVSNSPFFLRAPTARGGHFDTLALREGDHKNLSFYVSGDIKYIMRGPGRALELYGEAAKPQPPVDPPLFYSKEDGNTDGSIQTGLSQADLQAGRVLRIRNVEVDKPLRLDFTRTDGVRDSVNFRNGKYGVNLAVTGDTMRYHIAEGHLILKLWGKEE